MKLKIPASSIRAAITPNSYNEADNTIEVVFATEYEVQRRTWDGTKFIEVLDCSPTSVRMERLNAGANLVDTHMTGSVQTILGKVERAWIENKQGKAIIRLSKRAEIKGIVDDIKDGIISNISVGYNIYGAREIDNDNEVIKIEITDWEPTELTACSVPADYNASTRSQENENYFEINISQNTRSSMTPEEIAAEAERVRIAGLPPAPPSPVAAPAAAPTPVQQVDTAAIAAAENTRIMEIMGNVRVAGIDDHSFLETLLKPGVTIEAARSAIFTKLQDEQSPIRSQNPAIPGMRVNADEIDKVRTAMSVAIEHRVNPTVTLTDEARGFRGLSMIELGRECLTRAGVNTRGMDKVAIAQAALNLTRAIGMNGTSDFPTILGNTINRTLRAEYDLQERTFTQWANRGTARDFRTMTRVSLGEVGDFKEVKEGGEYEYTTLGEAGESYKVVKYGQIIAYTWEMMINDDLDAFSRIPRKIAAAAARKQSDLVYGILTGNPNMADGTALFHANHKNLATAAAISIDSFGLMRKLMRVQKGIDSKDFLNLTPQFLITGPTNEQLALQYTSQQFTANVAGNVNVWAGLVKPVIEPRITDTSWFFAASPNAIDTIEYSFLEGQGDLFTTQREGFEVDGVEVKARMVFGCKAIDWRGLAKNAGA